MITIKPHSQQNRYEQYKRDVNFKSAPQLLSTAFNFLNTNPALGAVFVDFSFMVTPRTAVDTFRNPDAGLETGFRESSSSLNHALAGVMGLGAGTLAAAGINKANGVKAHRMFMNSEAIEVFGKFAEQAGDMTKAENSRSYLGKFIDSLSYLKDDKVLGLKDLDATVKNEIIDLLADAKTKKYALSKNDTQALKFLIGSEVGAIENFRIVDPLVKDAKGNLKILVEGTIVDLANNAVAMRDAAIDTITKGKNKIIGPQFIKNLKGVKANTAIAGLAVPVAIGMSLQPFNAWMTKKRTGQEGFVGSEGRQPDKSEKFKIFKTLMGAGTAAAMLRTIGPYKDIISNVQYKGLVPTINQFKLIYAMTIFSRMLAARDKDELRESTIKDTLGFVNWLILGGFVSKLVSNRLGKDLINYDSAKHGKSWWNWITKAAEKSHEEILYPVIKKLEKFGISNLDSKGNSMSFNKLMKMLAKKAKEQNAPAELIKEFTEVSKKIKYKNIAQASGYIYSGLVLGIGIPKLNIAITKWSDKRKKAKAAGSEPLPVLKNQSQIKAANIPMIKENKVFSSFWGSMAGFEKN